MQVDLTTMDPDDLEAGFGGTIVRLKSNKELVAVTGFCDVENLCDNPFDLEPDDIAASTSIGAVPLEEIEIWMPDEFYLNHKFEGQLNCAFVGRNLERQWRRSFNANLYYIQAPNPAELLACNKSLPEHVLQSCWLKYYNARHYYTVDGALELLSSGQAMSVAISDNYCIFTPLYGTATVLCYKTRAIGTVTEDGTALLESSLIHLVEDLSQFINVELFDYDRQ